MKRGRKPKPLKFKEVLELVKQGFGTKEAILKCGYTHTGQFYKRMTIEQVNELHTAKVANRKYGNYFGLELDINVLGGEDTFI